MRRFIPVSVLVVTGLALATSAVSSAAGASVPAQRPGSNGAGSVGVRLVDIPADLADDPRARHYVIDNLAPGTTVHRRIEVSNSTASSLHVDVYPDAASIARGAFIGAAGKTTNELTSWTTLSQDSLEVPAGGIARDTMTIAVPQDAAPGERYAVIWAQASGDHNGGGVALVNRTGVRVYLSVSGNNPPPPKFTADTMTAERSPDGQAIVQALVHNTGGRALDLNGTLKLSQVSGRLNAGPYNVELGTSLAPGQSEPVKILVTDPVEDGPWNATIELKSGLLDESYQAQITFPHNRGATAAFATHPVGPAYSHPLLMGVLVALVVLLGAALVIATSHRRRGDRKRETEIQPATP